MASTCEVKYNLYFDWRGNGVPLEDTVREIGIYAYNNQFGDEIVRDVGYCTELGTSVRFHAYYPDEIDWYAEDLTFNFTIAGVTTVETVEVSGSRWSTKMFCTHRDKYQYFNLDGKMQDTTYSLSITSSTSNVYTKDENGNFIPFNIEGILPLSQYISVAKKYAPQYASILTAPNFSDEENPTITYSRSSVENQYLSVVDGFQAIISLDGTNDDIVRDINFEDKTITSITFNLTEEERNLLRANTQGDNSRQVLFRVKSLPSEGNNADNIPPYYTDLTKTLTIAGAYVSATLDVEDIDPKTLALTGDKNTIVKYHSDASYVINATATKGATIISEQVTCGSKSSTTETGVLENIESNIFTFGAVDSRNNAVAGTLTKNFIDYIKPTCQQKIEIDLAGAASTGAAAVVKISGNYFNGSFGAVDNTLTIQLRHTQNDGSVGDWITIPNVSINNNTYSVEYDVVGLDYAKPYVFQSRAIDKLNTVITEEFNTRVMPVFDWSGEDFNFNVPVNINADTLNIEGNTVIRHTGTNTVLSGNNGHIYLRPNGSDDTSSQTIFYGNGNIEFGGTVNFNNSFTVGGNTLEDFVIASGEEAMGSNGTWYWRKWASGKAECWGCRNFGNMGISTAFGSLYRSTTNSQALPSNLFKTTPDVIHMSMLNGGDGCWIAKWNDVAPSAVTSGSFVVINPVKGNVTPTNISFYVAGLYK